LGVPPTYPIQKVNGYLVSGFITPDISLNYTYPPELKEEIQKNVGKYILDANFRTENKDKLLEEIYQMTKIQLKTIKYLIKNKEWDFCQFITIGLDRIHHAFWKYYDILHPKYESNNPFKDVMKNYYEYMDKEIGEILEIIDKDTIVFIVSDHGAKAMKGCICVNMVLEKLGLLKFQKEPKPGTRLENTEIDWSRTYAWGWGGYYARIFLNVKGRESEGVIPEKDYDFWRDKISKLLKGIKDPNGREMNTIVYKPEDIYSELKGDFPDLMVYFDDLNWRSAGTVGYESIYLDENDTGPDDAVHDYYGIYIIYDPEKRVGKDLGTRNILDIAPTILNIFEIDIPKDMEGKIIKF